METYNNGAKRSDSKPFYREIPLCALRREGEALRLGAEKYNEQIWESNWRKGDVEYALSCLDHAFEHLTKLSENYKARLCGLEEPWGDEDHLGHLRANTAFLAWFEEQGRFACVKKTDEELLDEAAEILGKRAIGLLPLNKEAYDPLRVMSKESLRQQYLLQPRALSEEELQAKNEREAPLTAQATNPVGPVRDLFNSIFGGGSTRTNP